MFRQHIAKNIMLTLLLVESLSFPFLPKFTKMFFSSDINYGNTSTDQVSVKKNVFKILQRGNSGQNVPIFGPYLPPILSKITKFERIS